MRAFTQTLVYLKIIVNMHIVDCRCKSEFNLFVFLCVCLFSPIPHIVWRKVDATDLPPNHEISESGAVLHLYNVQYEDVGGYECEAINTKGKDWHKAWLYVECK